MLSPSNNRDFTAPYEFHEFPKFVKLADGSKALAQNAAEEAVLTAPPEDDKDDPERAELLAKAQELGMRVHPNIGTDKLREKLAGAQE